MAKYDFAMSKTAYHLQLKGFVGGADFDRKAVYGVVFPDRRFRIASPAEPQHRRAAAPTDWAIRVPPSSANAPPGVIHDIAAPQLLFSVTLESQLASLLVLIPLF